MADTVKPSKLVLPHLPAIHMSDSRLGKTLEQIMNYINQNVTPAQGNKVAPK